MDSQIMQVTFEFLTEKGRYIDIQNFLLETVII